MSVVIQCIDQGPVKVDARGVHRNRGGTLYVDGDGGVTLDPAKARRFEDTDAAIQELRLLREKEPDAGWHFEDIDRRRLEVDDGFY